MWRSTSVVVVFAFVLVLHNSYSLYFYLFRSLCFWYNCISVFRYLDLDSLKVDSFWSSLCNKGNTFPHIFVF